MSPSTVPPLTAAALLSRFHLDVAGLVVVLAAGTLYAAGLLALRRRGTAEPERRWPVVRTLVFGLGLVVVLFATVGGLGVYARVLFGAFTVQVLVLLVGAPLLLAAGRPLELFRAVRRREGRSRVEEVLANPLLGPAALPVLTALVFFSPALDAALREPAVGAAVRVLLLAAGLVFALPLLGDNVPRTSLAVALAAFVGFFELLLDAVPGIVLRLHATLLTPWFAELHRTWGPSPLIDQQNGGSILWVVAEAVDLPFLALIVLQWIRADQREAAVIDEQLDQQRPASTSDEGGEAPATDRPWWETDASVFGDSRSSALRRR